MSKGWSVVVVMLFIVSCGGDPEVQGSLGASCFPNDTCNTGLVCAAGTCRASVCGDGFKLPAEACDDGNTVDGDGCSASCALEACGNGVVDSGEQCDDGNAVNGDGCSTACTTPLCGNGIRDMNEPCDDGNTVDGDGCSASCALETCGNGVVDSGEQCDDGNAVNGDGCSTACTTPLCGNGIRDMNEPCDDGNLQAGDGCSATCVLESCGNGVVDAGEDCDSNGESTTCNLDCTTRTCGDGKVNKTAGEQCDALANNADNRDCRADCTLNTCGDGKFNSLGPANVEECDDGNGDNSDGCSTACTTPFCGNGIVEQNEECDDGNGSNFDGCQTTCTYTMEAKICLNGSTGRGRSVALNPFTTLTAATIEFWYRSADPNTPATTHSQLVIFHPLAYVGGDYPAIGIDIADATALAMGSLSGRTLGVTVDARGGPQNQLNARGFDIDATHPGFDEKGWHHYAIVFTGTQQRAFVDGVELTTTAQRDGSQATSFASAFGPNFTSTFGSLFMSIGYFARDNIRYMRGGISDLRVSNLARYTTGFTPAFRLEPDANTLLLLPMAENTGSVSYDTSSNDYDVTWSGGFSWSGLLLPCP